MTSGSRDEILTRIRTALGGEGKERESSERVERRLADPPTGPRPALGIDTVAQFIAKGEGNGLNIDHIASLQFLVPAIARLLPEADAAPEISIAPALVGLGWPEEWHVNYGAGRRKEHLSVTLATAGIAETGSVIFRSGPETPASLNFLPEIHVVVLKTSDILAHPEDVWARFRTEYDGWPRAMNVIAGPSRTADVGGIVVRPAHGPKAVHLFLVEDL